MAIAEAARIRKLYASRNQNWNAWRDIVDSAGIDATLNALGFPLDRNALWYNQHSGSIEPLDTLITENIVGSVKLEDQTYNFAISLEHWLPQNGGSNPILDRAKALTEEQVKERIGRFLKRELAGASDAEKFVKAVGDSGGSFEDGLYDARQGRGTIDVSLHDGRKFMFPLRSIYKFIKSRDIQPALF